MVSNDRERLPEYQQSAHLKGVGIGVRQAAKKYDIAYTTIRGWISRGYIRVLGTEGRTHLLDEADVAYCAMVYHRRRGAGKWLFDKNGQPYQPVQDETKKTG